MDVKKIDFDKLISMLKSELEVMEFEHNHYNYDYINRAYYIQLLECVKMAKKYSMM